MLSSLLTFDIIPTFCWCFLTFDIIPIFFYVYLTFDIIPTISNDFLTFDIHPTFCWCFLTFDICWLLASILETKASSSLSKSSLTLWSVASFISLEISWCSLKYYNTIPHLYTWVIEELKCFVRVRRKNWGFTFETTFEGMQKWE